MKHPHFSLTGAVKTLRIVTFVAGADVSVHRRCTRGTPAIHARVGVARRAHGAAKPLQLTVVPSTFCNDTQINLHQGELWTRQSGISSLHLKSLALRASQVSNNTSHHSTNPKGQNNSNSRKKHRFWRLFFRYSKGGGEYQNISMKSGLS